MKNNNPNYPVKERNELLLNMFKNHGYDAKLVGNPNQPAIVIDGKFAISGYVHNKIYHFTNKPFGGQSIHRVTLCENPIITKRRIQELIDTCEKRKLWKICCDYTICDENNVLYLNSIRNNEIYFSPTDARIFFSYQKAEQFLDILDEQGIPAKIETPVL